MRSECVDSRTWDCTADAVWPRSTRLWQFGGCNPYLCALIKGEGTLAFYIIISPATKGVMRADNDLALSQCFCSSIARL